MNVSLSGGVSTCYDGPPSLTVVDEGQITYRWQLTEIYDQHAVIFPPCPFYSDLILFTCCL